MSLRLLLRKREKLIMNNMEWLLYVAAACHVLAGLINFCNKEDTVHKGSYLCAWAIGMFYFVEQFN